MATTKAQVEEAIAAVRATKRLASGKVNRNAVYAVLKRFKAAHWWEGYEDTEFSKAIHKAAFDFINGK